MAAMLSEIAKVTIAITPTAGAAGTSVINGAIVDMANFSGVLIVVPFGTITAGAVTSIKAQQGNDPALADAADLAGTGQTIADTDDDKTFYIDIKNPTDRYVRLVVSRATQNAVVGGATYLLYGPSWAPVTHGAGVAGERWASPAEGVA